MLLILTHENADFDAVAALLAASKLYPEGIPLLPRRVNRNVSQFLTLYWDALPFVQMRDWRRKRVEQVVVVDTHTINSVRGMVRHPDVQVIDHHVGHSRNQGWSYQVDDVGATTTLMVEMIQTAGITLSAEESTLLLLGIYEDTGSLTYEATTTRDIRAAAYLLESGAQLAVVRRFMNVALTPAQRELYEKLQQAAVWIESSGHTVVIAAAMAADDFDEEISSIVHRLRDALLPVALFVLVGIQRDVQLVARSTSGYIDVSVIAKALGGGGHERAAAAMVIDRPLREVTEQVKSLLAKAVKPMATVAQIMSHGVRTIAPTESVVDAAALMQRLGYEGYPVIDAEQGQLVGLLTRRAVDRAMSHGLGNLPVSRIMKAGTVKVQPSDSIERVQELMLEEGWGQIPVVEDGQDSEGGGEPIGIVTRTDVLNHIFAPSSQTITLDMRSQLLEPLSPALRAMLLTISEVAAALHMPLYFVGGVVRDLLLGKPASDLDMVVEGDAIRLVRRLKSQFGGEIHTHSRFGTAKWFATPSAWQQVIPDESPGKVPATIDFVTARREFYTEPSALPEVEQGSIKLDLHRRDFTINTLAVRLDGPHLGQLLDFYGGRRDLDQGIIRVLHSLSFIDDPTRILRAIRLEQRLGFRIEPRTVELIAAALPMLVRMTGSRIRHELELALHEDSPARIFERMEELNVLANIHPGLRWTAEIGRAFSWVPELRNRSIWGELLQPESIVFVLFALWMAHLPEEVGEEVMERLRVRKATRQDVAAVYRAVEALDAVPDDLLPSRVAEALRPFSHRVLAVVRIIANESDKAGAVDRYYQEWQHVRTCVTGADLLQMGLKPGPLFAIILDQLLAAKIDGKVKDEAGERELLMEIMREQMPERTQPSESS